MRNLFGALPLSRRGWLFLGVVAVAVAAGVGIGALAWAGSSKAAVKAPVRMKLHHKGLSKLFVVDGGSGSAVRNGTGSWRLTVKDVSVLWFADRPTPASATQSAASLAAQWRGLFPGNPPYGAVLAPSGPAGHHPTAVQITAPTWDAASHTFSVTLKPDKGESLADADWLSKLTPAGEGGNGRVIMFVDGSSYTYSFSVSAPSYYSFTPDTSESTCATPNAITADPGNQYQQDGLFDASTAVSNAGWCGAEQSSALWDIHADGSVVGQLELDFFLGSISAYCNNYLGDCGGEGQTVNIN
jgi:hypothetical protein